MADEISNPTPPANFPKQAVVVIHGMGEQQPMDTITAFVRAAWQTDASVLDPKVDNPSEVWSKPDDKTGTLELRRITTRQSRSSTTFKEGVRTDFFELYWADLSGGSTLAQVESWVCGLLFRNPCNRVPAKLRLAWTVLWLSCLAILYLAAASVIKPEACAWSFCPYGWVNHFGWLKDNWAWIGPLVAGAIALGGNYLVVPYFGRVVRYTTAKPDNVAARKEIRERGMALLDALHDGTYDRILLVSHSLGSILGYDLLNYYWASRPQAYTFAIDDPDFKHLIEIERCVAALRAEEHTPQDKTLSDFRTAQATLQRAMRARPKPTKVNGVVNRKEDRRWLITDFVTVGSPLTHSDILLTTDMTAFRQKIENRQYSVCPPVREILEEKNVAEAKAAGFILNETPPRLMSFPFTDAKKQKRCWQLHYATPFSAVRWTNIHDPARLIFCGDIVSGPVGGTLFGTGVVDVDLRKTNKKQSWRFTHLLYW